MKIYILAFGIVFFCSMCGKRTNCNRSKLKKYNYPTEMQSYFDVFKEGNWWVYTNTTNTKTDSVYITGYSEKLNESCQFKRTTIMRQMTLKSTYIYSSPPSDLYYETHSKDGAVISSSWFSFNYANNVISNSINNSIAVKTSITVNNVLYHNVLYHDVLFTQKEGKTWLAPNVGIIKLQTAEDTFLLKKYLIQ